MHAPSGEISLPPKTASNISSSSSLSSAQIHSNSNIFKHFHLTVSHTSQLAGEKPNGWLPRNLPGRFGECIMMWDQALAFYIHEPDLVQCSKVNYIQGNLMTLICLQETLIKLPVFYFTENIQNFLHTSIYLQSQLSLCLCTHPEAIDKRSYMISRSRTKW